MFLEVLGPAPFLFDLSGVGIPVGTSEVRCLLELRLNAWVDPSRRRVLLEHLVPWPGGEGVGEVGGSAFGAVGWRAAGVVPLPLAGEAEGKEEGGSGSSGARNGEACISEVKREAAVGKKEEEEEAGPGPGPGSIGTAEAEAAAAAGMVEGPSVQLVARGVGPAGAPLSDVAANAPSSKGLTKKQQQEQQEGLEEELEAERRRHEAGPREVWAVHSFVTQRILHDDDAIISAYLANPPEVKQPPPPRKRKRAGGGDEGREEEEDGGEEEGEEAGADELGGRAERLKDSRRKKAREGSRKSERCRK